VVSARQNSTLRNFVLPEPIITKLGMVDYVGDPYSVKDKDKIKLPLLIYVGPG